MQEYNPEHRLIVKRVGIWGIGVNLFLSIFKAMLGLFGASYAMIADAVHSLSDCSSDLAMVIGVRYWTAPADGNHPHGHARLETLVSLFIGLGLIGVASGILFHAVTALHASKNVVQPRLVVFYGGIVVLFIKECMYQWSKFRAFQAKSRALLANAWHHRSDALSTFPPMIAVVGTRIWPDFLYLDQLAAIVVAVLILHAAWKVIVPSLKELMDTAVNQSDYETIYRFAKAIEGVKDVHKLRTRRIGGGIQVDLHVLVAPELTVKDAHDVADRVEKALLQHHPSVVDVLVHLEPSS